MVCHLIYLSNRKNQEALSYSETMAPFSLRVAVLISRKGLKARSRAKRERVKRLKREMEGERDMIMERQREVKEKMDAVELECKELKRETRFIIQQSGRTQIKLAIMFRILKARETGDLDSAAKLTRILREIVGKQQEEKTVTAVDQKF